MLKILGKLTFMMTDSLPIPLNILYQIPLENKTEKESYQYLIINKNHRWSSL